MKKTVYILFILISIKLSAQDNMTSLSFRNISSLSTRVGAPGLAITTQGFVIRGMGVEVDFVGMPLLQLLQFQDL